MVDVAIIGGGIAGVSVAAMLPPTVDVVVLESEAQLGAHSTGRSAALFYETYGHPSSVRLTTASRPYVEACGVLSQRGALTVAPSHRSAQIAEMADASLDPDVEVVTGLPALRALCDVLTAPCGVGALEPNVADLDVMGLHTHFVREARGRNVEIHPNARVIAISRQADGWLVETEHFETSADVIVNAAGAWGDEVARLAGVRVVGLKPLRRTAFTVAGVDQSSAWPAVADIDHAWYFKPEGPQLLCSPAEETLDQPGDPRPRMEDVALGIERINAVSSLQIRSVTAEWTGLRTFARDRAMVIGFDEAAPGFFWLVGQGGTGIQTAPAAGALAASLIAGELPSDAPSLDGVKPADYSPSRLRRSE